MDYEFPPAALFKTISHCRRCEQTPRIDGHLGEWSSAFALPPLHELGGGRGYANLSMGWDERGLYVAAEVPRVEPVVVNRQNPAAGDALELFIDTRAGQTGHRATQFCYHLWALPGGGAGRRNAVIWQTPIRRAMRRSAPLAAGDMRVSAQQDAESYGLEVALDADALLGLEARPGARIAVAIVMHDVHNGRQFWGTTRDFPYERDPSTWGMVELVDGPAPKV